MRTRLGLTLGVVIALSGLVAPLILFGKQDRRDETTRLRLFFSPDAPPSKMTVTRFRKIQASKPGMEVDLHLLVADFRTLSSAPSGAFQTAVKTLQETAEPQFGLSIFDEEGLRLAARYGLSRLPAAVLEHGGRIHVAYGSDPDLEELLRCKK